MKKSIFIFLAAILSTYGSQAQWWQGQKTIEGNGKMTSANRSTSNYDALDLTGSMDVQLVSGTEGNLRIEAEENLLEYIVTDVEGGKLRISTKKGYNLEPSRNKEIKIIVPFRDLSEVSLTGSGDIFSSEVITADNFETTITGSGDIKLPVRAKNAGASITGSGDIELSGSGNDFNCKVTGSGDIQAFDFKCERVDAVVIGSGDIHVFATEELRAKIPGAGDIVYKGNPQKEDFKTLGVGSISKQ